MNDTQLPENRLAALIEHLTDGKTTMRSPLTGCICIAGMHLSVWTVIWWRIYLPDWPGR